MTPQQAEAMLASAPAVRHPCDLDLLLFFRRHPLALLTSEQLTAVVGYPRERVAKSLDLLTGAGVLRRLAHPSHAARLFALERGVDGDLLAPILEFAATRPGRRQLMTLLARNASSEASLGTARSSASVTTIAKKAA